MGKMFKTDGIFGGSDICLDHIGPVIASKLVGGYFLQELTLCAKSYLEVMY